MQPRVTSQQVSSGDETMQYTSAPSVDGIEKIAARAHTDISGQSPAIRGPQTIIGLKEGLSSSSIPTMPSYMNTISTSTGMRLSRILSHAYYWIRTECGWWYFEHWWESVTTIAAFGCESFPSWTGQNRQYI